VCENVVSRNCNESKREVAREKERKREREREEEEEREGKEDKGWGKRHKSMYELKKFKNLYDKKIARDIFRQN